MKAPKRDRGDRYLTQMMFSDAQADAIRQYQIRVQEALPPGVRFSWADAARDLIRRGMQEAGIPWPILVDHRRAKAGR